jgi:hypothetical protein
LIVLRSVYFLVKFQFFIQELWDYSSNCRRFFLCHAVNWEPLGQFTSNFAQLLELIVLWSVYFLVKFRFFIQELWERKSLQILYECWRRAYHALLAQLFIICFNYFYLKVFSPGDRAGLIDDVFYLARLVVHVVHQNKLKIIHNINTAHLL